MYSEKLLVCYRNCYRNFGQAYLCVTYLITAACTRLKYRPHMVCLVLRKYLNVKPRFVELSAVSQDIFFENFYYSRCLS